MRVSKVKSGGCTLAARVPVMQGGIMSAAMDGLKVAEAVIQQEMK